MKPVIEIHQLGKKYRIGKAEPYLALRDVLSNTARNIFRKENADKQDFWALQDINLSIEKGERIGIIGRNGAGKSTLLKILSRVTWPTTGSAVIRGRLASLLEVGTGFHPELTGRENIYLNGSILGLRKSEINKQFDAIVDFSGIEPFLDTPLKNYSSGMQLRLAFAVAAHLEPEVLLIDEVLAVGDIEFQKKCIGKMEEVSKQHGRTVLFVSHNMAAITQLCTNSILLEDGKISYKGDTEAVISHYTKSFYNKNNINDQDEGHYDISKHANKISSSIGLLEAQMYVDNKLSGTFIPGSDLRISLTYKIDIPLIDPEIGIIIKDSDNISLLGWNNKHIGQKLTLTTGKNSQAVISIPKFNIFAPGKYSVDLFFGDVHQFYECLYNCFEFIVSENDIYKTGILLNPELNKLYIENVTIKA